MNKHTASYAGRTFTRNSKARHYTHAVLVIEDPAQSIAAAERRGWVSGWERERHARAQAEAERFGDGKSVGVWSWCGRHELAVRQADQARKAWAAEGAEVVIVEAREG